MSFEVKSKKESRKPLLIVAGVLVVGAIGIGLYQFNNYLYEEDSKTQAEAPENAQQYQDLSDQQKALIDKYGSQEKEILDILQGHKWSNATQTNTLEIANNRFVERSDGKTNDIPFAICNVAKKPVDVTSNISDSRVITCLTSDDQYFSFNLYGSRATGDLSDIVYTLECDKFAINSTYIQVTASGSLTYSGLSDKMFEGLPVTKDEVVNKVKEFVTSSAPSTTNVDFDNGYTVDFDNKVYVLTGICNNASKLNIQVVIKDNEVSVSKSAGTSTSKK